MKKVIAISKEVTVSIPDEKLKMTESTSERLLVLEKALKRVIKHEKALKRVIKHEKALKEIIKHVNNLHLNNKDKTTGISTWEEIS